MGLAGLLPASGAGAARSHEPKPDVVALAVGGGGLLCGVLQGLHARGWDDVPVVAAETDGAASLAAAIAAGRPVMLPAITSIATSLGARQVSARAFAWTREHAVHSAVVSDAEAVRACLFFVVVIVCAEWARRSRSSSPGRATKVQGRHGGRR